MINYDALFLLIDSSENENDYRYTSNWLDTVFKMSDHQFIEIFRIDKKTFNRVYAILFSDDKTANNRKEFLIFLLYLSHASTYKKLREMTGISYSTCWRVLSKKLKKFINLLKRL
jgi:hypothetical protein